MLFGIPRFLMVLDANQTRNYNHVSIILLVMWFTPYIFFLTRKGRKIIGIIRTTKHIWLVYFQSIVEELLYRGQIHQDFVSKFGNNKASIIDSLAFTIVHLAHFGIIYNSGIWQILYIPAFLLLLLMFLTSRMFFSCKSKSESIYGAILSHAGFNLAMTFLYFTVFYDQQLPTTYMRIIPYPSKFIC